MKQQILWNTAKLADDGTWTVSLWELPDENPPEWDSWSTAFENACREEAQLNPPLPVQLIRGALLVESLENADEIADRLEAIVAQANKIAERDAKRVREAENARRQHDARQAVASQEMIDRLKRRPPAPPLP